MSIKLNYHQRQMVAHANPTNSPVDVVKQTPTGTFVHLVRSDHRAVYFVPRDDGTARFIRTIG